MSPAKKTTSNNFLKSPILWGFIGTLAGSIATILIPQIFLKKNKLEESRIEIRKDIIKENYSLYNKLLFWSQMNTQVTAVMVDGDSILKWKKQKMKIVHLGSSDSVEVELRGAYILRLLIDTTLQKLSNQYTNEISVIKFKIDPSILQGFERLENYKKQMQFLSDSTLSNLVRLGWADGKVFQKWKNLNIDFQQEIFSFVNFD